GRPHPPPPGRIPGSWPSLSAADSSDHRLLSIMSHRNTKSCNRSCQSRTFYPVHARASFLRRSELRRSLAEPLLQEYTVGQQPVRIALVDGLRDVVHLFVEQPQLLPQNVQRRLAALDRPLRRIGLRQRQICLERRWQVVDSHPPEHVEVLRADRELGSVGQQLQDLLTDLPHS